MCGMLLLSVMEVCMSLQGFHHTPSTSTQRTLKLETKMTHLSGPRRGWCQVRYVHLHQVNPCGIDDINNESCAHSISDPD